MNRCNKRLRVDETRFDFEQIEMLANFSDHNADYPKLSFEQIAEKLGVDFRKAQNGEAWEVKCREVFERERE
jgi:hypothetical protein